MSEPFIREATRADLPAMLGLWRLLEAAQGAHRMYPMVADPQARAEALLLDAIDDPDARAFVAEGPDGLRGMAVARVSDQGPHSLSDARVVDLSRVVVAPDARGLGVGAALIAAAEEFARERGAAWLEAKMFTGNEAGRGFWDRIGFRSRFEQRVRRVDPT